MTCISGGGTRCDRYQLLLSEWNKDASNAHCTRCFEENIKSNLHSELNDNAGKSPASQLILRIRVRDGMIRRLDVT